MNNPEQSPPAEPQTFINGELGDIEQLYHLARRGVEIEYEGYSGRPLAMAAAQDLEVLGHPQASTYIDEIFLERYNEFEANPTNPLASIDGLLSAQALYQRGVHQGKEQIAYSAGSLVDNRAFELVFVGHEEDSQVDYERTLSIRQNLLGTLEDLHAAGIPDLIQDIERGYKSVFELLRMSVSAGYPLAGTYRIARRAYEAMCQTLPEDAQERVEQETVAVLEDISRSYDSKTGTTNRAATMNALADLREYQPKERRYKKLARAILATEHKSSIFKGKNIPPYSREVFDARARLERGTWFDPAIVEIMLDPRFNNHQQAF